MHVHAHGGGGAKRVLKISLGVTLAYIALLVVAGIRAHSLALLSEAGHNLSDFLALLLSLVAVYLQSRGGAGCAGQCRVAARRFFLHLL
jgi:cobalt-zinc-cadmium efflux system protein